MLLISRSPSHYQIYVHNGYSEHSLKLKKGERQRDIEIGRVRAKAIEREDREKGKENLKELLGEPFHKPPLVPVICQDSTVTTHAIWQSLGWTLPEERCNRSVCHVTFFLLTYVCLGGFSSLPFTVHDVPVKILKYFSVSRHLGTLVSPWFKVPVDQKNISIVETPSTDWG